MMKLLALLLCCLLLCGCTAQTTPEESTAPSAEAPVTTPVVTDADGFYDAGSTIEAQTNGAVRSFPLDINNVSGFSVMGDEILVFSTLGNGTGLTTLSGDTLYPSASLYLDITLTQDSPDVQVSEKGLSYFSAMTNEIVVLDTALNEISRIPAPEDLVGTPLLSADRNTLYYCTGTSVRAWDFESGIRRVLKELSYPSQSVSSLELGDSMLVCSITDTDQNSRTLCLSTETGETMYMTRDTIALSTSSDRYFAQIPIGATEAYVFGTIGQDAMELALFDTVTNCYYLPGSNAAAAEYTNSDETISLHCFDLETGLCRSSLSLDPLVTPLRVEESENGIVYIQVYDAEQNRDILLAWEPEALPSGDNTVYTAIHYTDENPDYAGLADCQLYADEISSRYGIRVLIGEEATAIEPWDYDMETEYRTSVIRSELEQLDARLSNYPEGMLQTLAERFEGLNICIVRSLTGTAESGSLDVATGIQFWEEFGSYIALAVGMDTEHALYHELCHLLESVILAESNALDSWEQLNPTGFQYDYSYITSEQKNADTYLQNETRYFMDTYSMTYPKEDRARIMEYAMTEGNGYLFQSKTMQRKLTLLCEGIREAFGLKKSPETFLWEQYLTESLAYTE